MFCVDGGGGGGKKEEMRRNTAITISSRIAGMYYARAHVYLIILIFPFCREIGTEHRLRTTGFHRHRRWSAFLFLLRAASGPQTALLQLINIIILYLHRRPPRALVRSSQTHRIKDNSRARSFVRISNPNGRSSESIVCSRFIKRLHPYLYLSTTTYSCNVVDLGCAAWLVCQFRVDYTHHRGRSISIVFVWYGTNHLS